MELSNAAKIQTFRSVFKGRADAYGADGGSCVKEALSDGVIQKHLTGKRRIGQYPLSPDIMDGAGVYWACVDIDEHDLNAAIGITNNLAELGISAYIEKSKSKGYHAWIFFVEPVDAQAARALLSYGLNGGKHEIFPKQDSIKNGAEFGNYVNLPLFGGDAAEGKTMFLDPKKAYEPHQSQWEALRAIQKIPPETIEGLIKEGELSDAFSKIPKMENLKMPQIGAGGRGYEDGDLNALLKNCRFIQHCRDHAGDLSEMLWYAMITNLINLPGGREMIHRLSKPYPAYSYEETEQKISHALKDAPGPHTCEFIREAGFECKLACGVKSPAGLAYKQEIAAEMPFPVVRQELFNRYTELFNGVTEAPTAYHFFCFAAAVGMMLEKRIFVRYPHPVYPNLFALLIGRSGYARKDTATRYAKNLTSQISHSQILPALASWEGLLQAMVDPSADPTQEPDLLENVIFEHVLVVLSEFDALLKKARNESVSNIIPNLCEIYDTPPEIRTPTRHNPLRVKEPFVSILAGIQPGVLMRAFQSGDIHGGFCGRFMYVSDEPKDPVPWPNPVALDLWDDLVKDVKCMESEWVSRASKDAGSMELTLAEDAKTIWSEFYRWHRNQNEDSELLSTLMVRIPEQVLKLSLIFAALAGTYRIEAYQLEDAISVGKWLMQNTRQLFRDFGQTEAQKAANRIVSLLSEESLTRRALQQNCRAFDAETFGKALSTLFESGIIEMTQEGKKRIVRLSE